jgi:hypothetical protein
MNLTGASLRMTVLWEFRQNIPNKLMRLTVAQHGVLGYGFKKHVPLDWRDDRFFSGNLVEEVLAGFEVLIYQARGGVGQPLRG